MDSEKSQELAVKSKLEQDRADPKVQKQTQVTGDNHFKDQLMPEQRKNIGIPQVEQNTSTSIEQGRHITPTYLNRPQAEKTTISKLSRSSNETPTKTTR